MAQHGGYRQPSNPAAVSGPGALSQRTDGAPHRMDVTGQPYGQNQATNAAQSAAPLAPQQQAGPRPAAPAQAPTPISAPSANPNQPVTAGADAGPGPSAAEAGIQPDTERELRTKFGPLLPVLIRMADAPYATTEYRRQVRQLIARITPQ